MNDYFSDCPTCDTESFINVSVNDNGMEFYSCTNELCENHAILFVMFDGKYIKVTDMMKSMREVKDELTVSG